MPTSQAWGIVASLFLYACGSNASGEADVESSTSASQACVKDGGGRVTPTANVVTDDDDTTCGWEPWNTGLSGGQVGDVAFDRYLTIRPATASGARSKKPRFR